MLLSSMAKRAHGDENGDLGVDAAWVHRLHREMRSEPRGQNICLRDALMMMNGLTYSTGVIDSDELVQIVELHRINMEDLLEKKGWIGKISVDAALAIWLYTLEYPSIYKAINEAMFAHNRRCVHDGSGFLMEVGFWKTSGVRDFVKIEAMSVCV
jgi:hypothetical protein